MATRSSWRLDGRALVREWRFRDFDTALGFVEHAVIERHHPDAVRSW